MPNPLTEPVEVFADVLEDKRPLVLFAGQNLDTASDAILGMLLARLGCAERGIGWRAAIEQGMSASDLEWLSERFDRSVPSDPASHVFDVAWSAVFTSSIDPRFARRFETRGRQPESVLSKDTYPKVPRSRSRPPIHYLFGKADETVEEARAPGNQGGLMRRLSLHATALVNRIAETATAGGLVVMAGYDPIGDWLPMDSLLAPLSHQAGPKVLWFGREDEPDSNLADEMLRSGSLVVTPETLTSAIAQLELRGVLDVARSAAPDEPGMVSLAKGEVLDVTPALRLRVEASASIVDDAWTEEPERLTGSELDDAFRRFHGALGNFRSLVEGVARGFAVEREFERTLWNTVKKKLAQLRQPDSDEVVVLHGQSGAGKSIALARLTRKVRRELHLPVLATTNRIPHHQDVEAFCQESERLETTTVLVCDSGQPPKRYEELASALRSRGRRLLIIGTCYRIPDRSRSNRLVEAPTHVSEAERAEFTKLSNKLDLPLYVADTDTNSIFAMLYRRLPVSRHQLAAGVSSEARAAEGMVRERAKQAPRPAANLSPIAQQLIELGIASETAPLFEDDEKLAALGWDEAGRLIDYVMAAGRLDSDVPVNLLFRVLGHASRLHPEQFSHLLADLDLFRWRQDAEGSDFLIAPRIQLEAELICRRRLTSEQEIERLIELIRGVRLGVDRSMERSFLLDLLFKLDRNGPRQEAYRSGYLRFADALKELREHNGIFDADIILRECVLRRRAVSQSQGGPDSGGTEDEHLAILDEARDTIETTLRAIDDRNLRVSRKTKQSLVVERSAIYGYLAVQHVQSGAGGDFWSDYLAARVASEKAIGLGRDVYPIDIALWTASDVFTWKKGELSNEQRAEVLADLYATIDYADCVFRVKDVFRVNARRAKTPDGLQEDSDPDEGLIAPDQTKYLERRSRVAYALGDSNMNDETLAALEDAAPEAATFLIARRQAEPVDRSEPPFDAETRSIAAKAADYLSGRNDAGIPLDDRCLRLWLRLRWAQTTGERLMFDHRGRTPVDPGQLTELLKVVSDLNEQAGADARNRERFLEAVLCWLLDDTKRAFELWRSLSHDTDYEDRSRVRRWLVQTDASGFPRRFRGRVELKGEDNWRVRAEGIGRPILLRRQDFPNDELAHGRELREFGIAFNYTGPIAHPVSHSR